MSLTAIDAVSTLFDVPSSTLAYWEQRGMVTSRRAEGELFYDDNQVQRIALICLWQETRCVHFEDIASVLDSHKKRLARGESVIKHLEALTAHMYRLARSRMNQLSESELHMVVAATTDHLLTEAIETEEGLRSTS